MKKNLAALIVPACAALLSSPALAQAAPAVSKADNAWILVSAALVILMSIPGLALFYGGLVRSKNMLSVLMQVFITFALISVLWVVFGYSLAFSAGGSFFGSFDKILLSGVTVDSVAGTFSKGVYLSEFTYIVFQGAFASITCALIVGAFAERVRFSAVLLFMFLWFSFSYLPMARMVWYWPGPDAYTDAAAAEAATATAGFLFQKGALDFAGGTVVHINAAVAGLIGAYLVGKRVGYARDSMAPHSLSLTMVGASLLWFGWFGFNAGSALEANGGAAIAMLNTWVATACATLSWMFTEWVFKGKPSMLGAASGAVAGLVAITPGAGFIGVGGAIFMGLAAGVVCLWGVNGLKRILNADDSLDVFGVHGVGGILGSLLTGIFCSPSLGGSGVYDYVTQSVGEYDMAAQMLSQTWGVLTAVVWSGVVSFVAYKFVDAVVGLRVPEEEEREGLDITSHGESAYHF
ncbi:MAG: ammonium transporter [Candidatus Accumulibacter sp.]|jgi:Amt family ammonium transporter|nr:ammonium transporter [Accumulibacter sp.]